LITSASGKIPERARDAQIPWLAKLSLSARRNRRTGQGHEPRSNPGNFDWPFPDEMARAAPELEVERQLGTAQPKASRAGGGLIDIECFDVRLPAAPSLARS
jgi:hypothetical protein